MTIIQFLKECLNISPELLEKIVLTIIILLVLSFGRFMINIIIKKRTDDIMKSYRWRRTILYSYTLLLLVIIIPIWIKGMASLATLLGLASAGIAISMHDTIANIAGWFFIISRKPYFIAF